MEGKSAIALIEEEIAHGAQKYGTQEERLCFWAARIGNLAEVAYVHLNEMTNVLCEEAGEAARAVLHNEGKDRIKAEVIQVIAVGFAILEGLSLCAEPRKSIHG